MNNITTSLFALLVGAALGSAVIKLQVTAEQANVREKPDILSAVLEQLPEGAILEAERKEGEWFAVLVEREEGGSVLGYVHESLVKVIEGEPEKEEKPAPPPAQAPAISPQEQKEEGMSMALWLGWRYAAIGDLNDGASGAAGYYQAMFQGSADASGEAKSLHFGRLFGLELRLPLSYGFSLAFGGEYFSGERASEVIFEIGSSQFIAKAEPRVRAVPLNVSLLYYPGPHLYLRAGIEYTFARCGYLYRLEQPLSWQEDEGYADAGALGYLLGIGTEWQLFSGLSCVAEAAYRRARFGDLEGVNIYRESTGYGSTKKGTLYYYQVKSSAEETFPLVFVREKKPADAGVITARKAELSLTGLSLKLGLRVRF